MAKSENNNTDQPTAPINPFGDMSLLREIIMGPKVIEYDQKNAEILALIKKNEDAINQRLTELEKDMNARFDRLEKLLAQNVDTLQKQLQNTSKTDKATMADLLVELSKKLKS
jgi:predicted HTH transcriptional regulator